jgi:hypothetical protein
VLAAAATTASAAASASATRSGVSSVPAGGLRVACRRPGPHELGALLAAAGHALLALNGLRVSEATGTDIEHLAWSAGTGR